MESKRVVFFKASNGMVPVFDWFCTLPTFVFRMFRTRFNRIELTGKGNDRPRSAYLRDKIYEFRVSENGINYRALFFFHGTELVVVANGFSKKSAKVPDSEINRAIARRAQFIASPEAHTHIE